MGSTDVIREGSGNLLAADVDALVNTVNTVGVMGKGLALQFRRAYPAMFQAYRKAALAGLVELGRMHVWPTGTAAGPRFVINFPTKAHWRARSRLVDVERGLQDLVRVVRELEITSVAVPPLGCGNGGLDWRDVEPRIRAAFAELAEVDVVLFPPGDMPPAAAMPDATDRPRLTPGRSALIMLLSGYASHAMGASLIEVQKLLYFLQGAGEPLRLNFGKARYGPYADNLRHVLIQLEGHYLSGFGDGSGRVIDAEPIHVIAGAEAAAAGCLEGYPETLRRIDRVLALSRGFESAYGMELLASVHWVAHQDDPAARDDPELAATLVSRWSPRKSRLFTSDHVGIAWATLHDHGWLVT